MRYLTPSTMFISRALRFLSAAFLLCVLQPNAFAQELPRPPGEQQLTATTEEMTNPIPANPPTTLQFGASLAVYGRTLLAGMPAYSTQSTNAPPGAGGRVAVFSLNNASRWVRTGTIDPTPHTPNDEFGSRVAVGDGFALVRANSGVFVFKRQKDTWKQIAKLTPAAGEHYDAGLAVSLGSLLVGVSVDNAPGRVYAFSLTPKGELRRVQKLQASPSEAGDGFGQAIATSRGTLVVGAPGLAEGQGAAFVYQQMGHKWAVYRKLTAPDQDPATNVGEIQFGGAVDVSNGVLVVGAPGADRKPMPGACAFVPGGAAYVYAQRGWRWTQTQKINSSDPCSADFAATVAISRGFLAAGAASGFPFLFDGVRVYRRTGNTYELRYEVFASEVSIPPVVMEGSHFVAGFPFDRFFSTGFALAYDLAEAP